MLIKNIIIAILIASFILVNIIAILINSIAFIYNLLNNDSNSKVELNNNCIYKI